MVDQPPPTLKQMNHMLLWMVSHSAMLNLMDSMNQWISHPSPS